MLRRRWPVLLLVAAAARGQAPPGPSLTGVWQVTGVPFGPWQFQLTARGSRVSGSVSQAEYDVATRESTTLRALPIDSGSVVDGRVVLIVRVPPDTSGRTITFVGVWTADSLVLTRAARNIESGPGAGGVFGARAADRVTARRAMAPNARSQPVASTAIPPCVTPTGVSGRWAAPFAANGPWVFLLCSDGQHVTGLVGQGGFDRPGGMTGALASCPIVNGVVAGTTMTFDCVLDLPTAKRVITFTGRVDGDSIVVERSVRSLAGDEPLLLHPPPGIFAVDAGPRFTVKRAAADGGSGAAGPRMAVSSGRAPPLATTVAYGRWTAAIADAPPTLRDAIAASIRRQLAMADSAVSRLPDSVSSYFRNAHIEVRPSALDPNRTDVGCSSGSTTVVLNPRVFADDHPVILQGLMMCYLYERVPGWRDNPMIHGLYQQAGFGNRYPATARLLQSEMDFFSLTAAVYLYGRSREEPLTRERLHAVQPDMYAWLEREFPIRR